MSVKINLGAWSSVFAVPSKIVDEGLKFSDGVKLKVLLYVLRNAERWTTGSIWRCCKRIRADFLPRQPRSFLYKIILI